MENIWLAIATFLGIYSLAIVSPGPNFILVTNTALNHSRRDGLLTALGVATGSGIFAGAGLVGLLPLAHALPYFLEIIRFAGGGYLLWIGGDMVRTCRRQSAGVAGTSTVTGASSWLPYRIGLITNLTNPKAWAFYLSLFTLIMGPPFPLWGKVFLNVTMFSLSLGWYAGVACLISSRTFRPLFLSWRPLLQGALGLLLMAVGSKILIG